MKRRLFVFALVSLVASGALAQLATTRFINLTDSAAAINYNAQGTAIVPIGPGNIIDVTGYRKISVLVGTTRATSMSLNIGKANGATLLQGISRPIGTTIQTIDVVGPEFSLWLRGGPPNTSERVQIWIYISS